MAIRKAIAVFVVGVVILMGAFAIDHGNVQIGNEEHHVAVAQQA